MQTTNKSNTLKILLGLAVIYVVWGSTYLAIRVAVETIPPFFMASSRFLVGGVLVASTLWLLQGFHLTKRQWFDNAIVGGFMILGGNGLVSWAETSIPSGIATLIVSMNPLFFVLGEWAVAAFRKDPHSSSHPNWLTFVGLGLGTVGLLILIGPAFLSVSEEPLEPLPVIALVMACLCWTIGSLYSRYSKNAADPFTGSAAQMLCGGLWLLIVSVLLGEVQNFSPGMVSFESIYAWLYLVVAGSLIAFPIFVWLMKHGSPTVVSTYAYVNPVVAVILGWWIMNERIDARIFSASAAIVAGVALISYSKHSLKAPVAPVAPESPVAPEVSVEPEA